MVSFGAPARLTSPSSTLRTDAATQTVTASFSPAASKTPPTIATYSEYEFDDSHSTSSEGTSAGELVDEVSYCKGEGDNNTYGDFSHSNLQPRKENQVGRESQSAALHQAPSRYCSYNCSYIVSQIMFFAGDTHERAEHSTQV